MFISTVLTALLAAHLAVAQKSPKTGKSPTAGGGKGGKGGKAQCQKLKEIDPGQYDPLAGFAPNTATFPCDMGGAVPLGKVPTGCAKLEIIVARGTSEPGNLGMVVGDPVVARVKRDLPNVSARGYPVQYPADTSHSKQGIADVQRRIKQQMTECPDEKFALVGYSQGGMVVQSAVKQLSPAQLSKVVAVVLYGAGDGSKVAQSVKQKTLANCAPGDFACPKSGKGPGHVSYNNKDTKWHDRSAAYIATAYTSKAPGFKLERTP